MPIEPAARELLVDLATVLADWGPWYVFGAQAAQSDLVPAFDSVAGLK